MTIAERIAMIISDANISQAKFAKAIKISPASVSLIVKGINNPSKQTIELICREFKVNRSWLESGEGEMHTAMSKKEQVAAFVGECMAHEDSDIKNRFILALSQLDDAGWEAVATLAEQLKLNPK